MRWIASVLLWSGLAIGAAQAEELPERLTPAGVARVAAPREEVGGPYGGVIFTPEATKPAMDGKYSQPYHAGCFGYAAERTGGQVTGYVRRFAVYAPEQNALPTAKRVTKLLLLLHGLNRERMKFDHYRNEPTVEVWLTRNPGAGLDATVAGEQFKNQIYFYNLYAERSAVEWMREVAHEYGHYALPGISGFTAPEEWGNGVLGERLLVKWLAEELRAGRLKAEDIPFATPEEIAGYIAKQVTPLVRRYAREGADTRRLARRDAEGMEAFVGLALMIDSFYGSEALRMAFAYSSSGQGNTFLTATDFVRGMEEALKGASEITLAPPGTQGERNVTFFCFLPRGEFIVGAEGAAKEWRFAPDAKAVYPQGKTGLIVNAAGWRKMTLSLEPNAKEPARLRLRRRGTEVP